MADYYFPFGEKLTRVQQTDTAPNKEVFVLGVYASAVHARWIGADNIEKVKAMAVASEPYIFWKGDDAEQIISSIKIPAELGRLEIPTNNSLNGPSSVALDKLFLNPLGVSRDQAWLCDLLPESRVNPSQSYVLKKHYTEEIIEKYNLAPATVPVFNENEIKNNADIRCKEIASELEASGAKTIILLGDIPIRWFINHYDRSFTSLSQLINTKVKYGVPHKININNKPYSVIPLCHPRTAARLGTFSEYWAQQHDSWVRGKLA